VNRQGETQDFCGGGAVDCAARAEPPSGDASPSNGNVKLSLTRTGAKWQVGASNGKPKMSAKNRAGPPCRAPGHDGVVRDDGDGTPPLAAAGTVDNPAYQKPRPAVIVTWRLKFPVPWQKFPVLLSREFRCKPLDLLVSRPSNSLRNAEFCKIPC
jgi:hypothetical protein